jgi:hypothetical protein
MNELLFRPQTTVGSGIVGPVGSLAVGLSCELVHLGLVVNLKIATVSVANQGFIYK